MPKGKMCWDCGQETVPVEREGRLWWYCPDCTRITALTSTELNLLFLMAYGMSVGIHKFPWEAEGNECDRGQGGCPVCKSPGCPSPGLESGVVIEEFTPAEQGQAIREFLDDSGPALQQQRDEAIIKGDSILNFDPEKLP